jgi:hypothetical protein
MDQPTRRSVLRLAVVAAVSAAVPVGLAGPAGAAVSPVRRTALRRGVFAPHVGSTFRLTRDGRTFRARLAGIADLTQAAGSDRRFSLAFDVAGAPPAGIYRVRHARLAAFDLYLGPVGRKSSSYEAVVSA